MRPGSCTNCNRFSRLQIRRFNSLERQLTRDVAHSPEFAVVLAKLREAAALVPRMPPSPRSALTELPRALQILTISFLTPAEHLRCRLVSRGLRAAAMSPHSWPALLHLPQPAPESRDQRHSVAGGALEAWPKFVADAEPFKERLAAELSAGGRLQGLYFADRFSSDGWQRLLMCSAASLTELRCDWFALESLARKSKVPAACVHCC